MSSYRKRERGKLVKEQFFRRGSRAYRSASAVCEWPVPCCSRKTKPYAGFVCRNIDCKLYKPSNLLGMVGPELKRCLQRAYMKINTSPVSATHEERTEEVLLFGLRTAGWEMQE